MKQRYAVMAISSLLWSLAPLMGCTELASADDTAIKVGLVHPEASTPVDPNDPFKCIRNGSAPSVTVPPSTSTKVRYQVIIVDFTYSTPIKGLTIQACALGDRSCVMPQPSMTTPPTSAMAPWYTIEVNKGFSGYFRMAAPEYITLDYYVSGALTGTPAGTVDTDGTPLIAGTPFAIPSIKELDDFFGGAQPPLTRDAKKGILSVRTLDCSANTGPTIRDILGNVYFGRAAGVSLNVKNPTGVGYRLVSLQPVFNTPPDETDLRGIAGYANMDPGNYDISGILRDKTIYGAPQAAAIKENVLTLVELRTDSQYSVGR